MQAAVDHNLSTVLLLDEHVQSCREARLTLEESGYAVTATCDAAEARALVQRRSFDVVVADIALTDSAGASLLAATQQRTPPVPLVVLSDRSEVDAVIEAIRLGAFDYVIKDKSLESLQSAVRRASERARLLHDNANLLRDLHRAHASLEERVQRRSEQLEQANLRLSAESAELARAVTTLRDTHTQLVQAEKTASLGLLTAGVAHEINNPLGFVLPNLTVLEQWVSSLGEDTGPTPES